MTDSDSNMDKAERYDIQERREIEFRQWTQNELAAETAELERILVDVLYKLEPFRDEIKQNEIAEAYRHDDVVEYFEEVVK